MGFADIADTAKLWLIADLICIVPLDGRPVSCIPDFFFLRKLCLNALVPLKGASEDMIKDGWVQPALWISVCTLYYTIIFAIMDFFEDLLAVGLS
jgi:hypothetical protein